MYELTYKVEYTVTEEVDVSDLEDAKRIAEDRIRKYTNAIGNHENSEVIEIQEFDEVRK